MGFQRTRGILPILPVEPARPGHHHDLAEQGFEGIDDLAELPVLETALSAYLREVGAHLLGPVP
jgi:hypothetical protein